MKNKRSQIGLGDTIEKLAKFFYLDMVANYIAKIFGKEDCGCTRRKNKLNKMFPYGKKK